MKNSLLRIDENVGKQSHILDENVVRENKSKYSRLSKNLSLTKVKGKGSK